MLAKELHRGDRIGWLRAGVLGANDGIVSTASLIVGVAAAHVRPSDILVAGFAGLVAGAMSMAAGEYVSVSSQADTEKADLDLERKELAGDATGERAELAAIYVKRGLAAPLADEVALQLMAHDALGAHSRDELGFSEALRARPLQAALASAATFAVGAALPILAAVISPVNWPDSPRCRELSPFPRRSRWSRCARRGRAPGRRSNPRHFLGRARDGSDRRRGCAFRGRRVNETS